MRHPLTLGSHEVPKGLAFMSQIHGNHSEDREFDVERRGLGLKYVKYTETHEFKILQKLVTIGE